MNSNNNNQSHILSKEGILTTFSIAKKITIKDVNKLRSKLMKKTSQPMDPEKLQEILKNAVIKETQNAMNIQKIPGLIVENIMDESAEKKRLMELTFWAATISKKLTDMEIDKFFLCFIINSLVGQLKLSEEDFEEFHRKFSKFREENGEGDGASDED